MFDTVGYLPLHPITVHPINIPFNIQLNPVSIPLIVHDIPLNPIKSPFFGESQLQADKDLEAIRKTAEQRLLSATKLRKRGAAFVDRQDMQC